MLSTNGLIAVFGSPRKPVLKRASERCICWASAMVILRNEGCSWACCFSLLAMGFEIVLIRREATLTDAIAAGEGVGRGEQEGEGRRL